MTTIPASGKYSRIKRAADELAAALNDARLSFDDDVFVEVEMVDVSTIHEIAMRYTVAVLINSKPL